VLAFLTSDESRLFYAVALNAFVLWASWRTARRINTDRLDAAVDAGMLFYLVQYASICLPGVVGALHPLTIGAVALLLGGAMAVWGARRNETPEALPAIDRSSALFVAACAMFVLGYVLSLVAYQRALPVISNDALTYHLPAAVQWLQTGRLGLYEAWFYNPANSYSPLAGSTFIAWLLAPIGNDTLARFVAVGPFLLLFLATLALCRRIGAEVRVAAMVAIAAVLARPIVGQTILAKDDLFVAAFFIASVHALSRERLEERVGAWRAGIAIGLLLATKFTVLLSLPILLLMLGRGWNARRTIAVFICIVVLAGPWYLRNIFLTGNPLYPTSVTIGGFTLLRGMLHVHRSALVATPAGAWHVFTGGYYGIPLLLACLMIAGWIGGLIAAGRGLLSDRLKRTAIPGVVIGIGLFVMLAPYGEMRFAYPSLLLMFVAMCIALVRLPKFAQLAAAGLIALVAAATAFKFLWARDFMTTGAIFALIGAGAAWIAMRSETGRKAVVGALAAACVGIALYAYVNWAAYVKQCEYDSTAAWSMPAPDQYGAMGEVWKYVRDETPPSATIAYANTYFTYPLMGFSYDHRVVYAPTRAGLERFVDMPPIPERISGEQITGRVIDLLRENPDRSQWLARLRRSGAQCLVVGKHLAESHNMSPPPELGLAAADPARFVKMFENEAGVVFRIVWQ